MTPIKQGTASRLGLRKPTGVDWGKAEYMWAEGLRGLDPVWIEQHYLNKWSSNERGAGNGPYIGLP